MTTRREMIMIKYEELKMNISKVTEKGTFLPDSNEIDLADYLFMVSYQFMNVVNDSEYEETIHKLMENNDCVLSEEEFKDGKQRILSSV